MLTRTDVKKVNMLTDEDYFDKLAQFEKLLPKMRNYVRYQAELKSTKLPNCFLDADDLESVGRAQVWIAVITWDSSKGTTLVNWAKRLIWSNMSVILDDQYQQKRVPRVIISPEYTKEQLNEHFYSLTDDQLDALAKRVKNQAGNKLSRPNAVKMKSLVSRDLKLEVMQSPISIFDKCEDGTYLYDTLEDNTTPINAIETEELYMQVRKRLLEKNKRVAAGVLRLSIDPDDELLHLCETDSDIAKRTRVRITNKALANRFGVTTSKIADAKVIVRVTLKDVVEESQFEVVMGRWMVTCSKVDDKEVFTICDRHTRVKSPFYSEGMSKSVLTAHLFDRGLASSAIENAISNAQRKLEFDLKFSKRA